MGRIDLNCDCGESFGAWRLGADEELLPHVTAANVACGGHAGDPAVMRRTVRLCRELGVAVGAHPGYPDLQGFGRRALPMAPDEIEAAVLAQIGALHAIARAEGVELAHVKPHGALYNVAAATPDVAEAIARAVAAFSRELVLVGLAGSHLVAAGEAAGLRVAREAFADRGYAADGALLPRGAPGALVLDPEANLAQALRIVAEGHALSPEGARVPVAADTLCIHGDTPGAAARAAHLRRGLAAAGVTVAPLAG
ncbi:MAG TPA: 5-oxoprolinase subunit PxpA [Chloroflexaceae bacterium]|nr:5-oxoprolinase subunit PxpA [Chloroflexaceae bacterium]